MTEPTQSRGKFWSSRVAIVALGLTIGLGARWLRQTWEYFNSPTAVSAPQQPTAK